MSETITIEQEIRIKIGQNIITLTKEEVISLYNQLGKALDLDQPKTSPFTSPTLPYTPTYPSRPIPNWNEYEMPPYRKWYGEPIMCVVGKIGPTMM